MGLRPTALWIIPLPQRSSVGLQLNMVPTVYEYIDSGLVRLHPEISLEMARDQERINDTPATLACPHAYLLGQDPKSSLS